MLTFLLETALKKHSQKLDGKIILIELKPLEKRIKIAFKQGNVFCSLCDKAEALPFVDLKISATPKALIAMLLRGDRSGLNLEGDVVLAQTLEHCLYNIIDENYLEAIFQDNFYPIKRIFKKGAEHFQKKYQKTQTMITDYLQEETDCLPLTSEVEKFCDEVDELRYRVDRLEARLLLKGVL